MKPAEVTAATTESSTAKSATTASEPLTAAGASTPTVCGMTLTEVVESLFSLADNPSQKI
jgi:hypothetical protein